MRAGRAAMQTGISAPSGAAISASRAAPARDPRAGPARAARPRHRPSRRRCRRRPAAAWSSMIAARAGNPAAAARARAARSTRLSGSAASAPPNGPVERRERSSAGASAELVGGRPEHRQAVQQVVAIRPPAGDVQVEVDLGRRRLGQASPLGGAGRVAGQAVLQLGLDLRRGPRSGSNVAARLHWKRASRCRPAASRHRRDGRSPRCCRFEFDRPLETGHRPGMSPRRNRPSPGCRRCSRPRGRSSSRGQHGLGAVEVLALVGPAIAEVVQHVGLLGRQLERPQQVGLGLRPAPERS